MRRAGRGVSLNLPDEEMFMSAQSKPSIVFCHGLWADGSCFSKLIPSLQADGHEVIAAQYALDTPEGDVATVIRTLSRVSSPAILVGHSYGGTVITAAGTDDRVVGLHLEARPDLMPLAAFGQRGAALGAIGWCRKPVIG